MQLNLLGLYFSDYYSNLLNQFFPFSWLLHDPKMKLRSMYPPFLHAVQKYFKKLLPKLVPLQVNVT